MSSINSSSKRRRRARIALVLASALAVPGCVGLTEAELRTILANSATTTTVATVNTLFTTTVVAALQNALTNVMNNLFGVKPILR